MHDLPSRTLHLLEGERVGRQADTVNRMHSHAPVFPPTPHRMTPSPPSVIINEVEMARRARSRKVREFVPVLRLATLSPSPLQKVALSIHAGEERYVLKTLHPFPPSLAPLPPPTKSGIELFRYFAWPPFFLSPQKGSFVNHFLPPSPLPFIHFSAMVVLAPLLHPFALGGRREN